jgi:hypothetical protein
MGMGFPVWALASVVGLLAFLAARFPRADIPSHLLGHPLVYQKELIDVESGKELNILMRKMASDETGFPTNVAADLKTGVGAVLHEHIGEAQKARADGSCAHPFLVPDRSRENCVLPQRVDVGRHFVMTGGPEAVREPYENMISRVSSFGRYMFNLTEYPVVESLFESDSFKAAAISVCPAGKQLLDPFQFNFIMQVPGQTVALHIDAPYYVGATRFQFPQWLLVAMTFSGLFQDRFVDQVQVVGYLHDWVTPPGEKPSGQFLYYPKSDPLPLSVPCTPLSGSAVDGSKTLHAAGVFRPDRLPPKMDKDADNALYYIGDELWELRTTGGRVLDTFPSSDVRMTIVYRGRCFAGQEEMDAFNGQKAEDMLSLESILSTLLEDLVARGKQPAGTKLADVDRLELSIMLLETYVKYPFPSVATTWMPLNYCALPRLAGSFAPAVSWLLRPLCGVAGA